MNKSRMRFISSLLCVCICIGLAPALTASALVTDTALDTSEIYYIQAGEAYPTGFDKGLVYKYTAPDTDGVAKIDVSVYKPNSIGAVHLIMSNLMWKRSDVYLTNETGWENLEYTGNERYGFASAKVTHSELLGTHAESRGTTVESDIMDKLFTYKEADVVEAAVGGYEMLSLVMDTSDAGKNGFKTVSGKNILVDPAVDELSLFTMYFKVKRGRTVTDKTFGLGFCVAAGLESGTVFKNYDDADLCKSTLFVGFPEGAETTYNYTIKAKVNAGGKAGEAPVVKITDNGGVDILYDSYEYNENTGNLSVAFSITAPSDSADAGTYSIKISKNKCTYFLLKDIPVGDGIETINLEKRCGTINLYAGDLNGDGYIGISDYIVILKNYGKRTEEGDITGDGIVNINDNITLQNNYNKKSIIQSWNQAVS